MMMKRFLALSALSAFVVSSVFAGGDKSAHLQLLPGSPTLVRPKRMAKVTVIDGKIRMTTPWIEVGDFAPAGPCSADEVLVFDHFGTDASGAPTGGENCRSDFTPDSRWYFGETYHNPYYANDILQLVDSQYNGATASSLTHAWFWNPPSGSEPCIILIFTVEQFDVDCQDVHDVFDGNPVLDGVALDYGTLAAGTGYYYSPVCLSDIGGIQLPATPADEGNPGTEVLGGYSVIYAQAFDPNRGTVTLASTAQPMLWSTQDAGYVGDSTSTQWGDDNPTDGNHTAPDECYDYTFNVCDNPPRILGGMMAFWVSPGGGCVPHNGDVDENGCVDDADLLAVLFAFGSTSGGREDVNCDSIVDDADLLTVLFNFGSGC